MTLRKFQSLAPNTKLRKLLLWTRQVFLALRDGLNPLVDLVFLEEALADCGLGAEGPSATGRYHHLHHEIRSLLGLEAGDWDMSSPTDGTSAVSPLSCGVFLEDLRSPFNVGSIIRTSEALGFTRVILGPRCPRLDHPRLKKTAMGSESHLTLQCLSLEEAVAGAGGKVFAVELGGEPLDQFSFPDTGLALLGTEELGLSSQALSLADQSWGRVSIPLFGHKSSLGVSVAWGIVAQKWGEKIRSS